MDTGRNIFGPGRSPYSLASNNSHNTFREVHAAPDRPGRRRRSGPFLDEFARLARVHAFWPQANTRTAVASLGAIAGYLTRLTPETAIAYFGVSVPLPAQLTPWAVLWTPVGATSSRMSTCPATLLVVDDDREFVAALEVLLPTLGYTVISAHSVREALDVLDTSKVDLVISDVRMPDVDGLDLIRILRHRFPRLPTVLMTGAPISDEDVIPREAKRILVKPVALDELERAVVDLLNRHGD